MFYNFELININKEVIFLKIIYLGVISFYIKEKSKANETPTSLSNLIL